MKLVIPFNKQLEAGDFSCLLHETDKVESFVGSLFQFEGMYPSQQTIVQVKY